MDDESKAIDAAVKECIEKDVLKDVLRKFKSEVIDMLLTEYDEVKTMNAFREEGYEEGRAEGREEGYASGLDDAVAKLANHFLETNSALSKEEAISMANEILRK